MKLYYSPGACSLAAHIVIEEQGIVVEYEKVDLKRHMTENGGDFREINPKNYVPVLRWDNGGMLTENVAILQYLADLKPETELAPEWASPERYKLVEWLAYVSTEIHKAFGPIFHSSDQNSLDAARGEILCRLQFVEDSLGTDGFLMGQRFSVADAYMFVMLNWCGKAQVELSRLPRAKAYRSRISSRSSVVAAMKAEGL